MKSSYTILPFRFERLSPNEYLLTNEVGEFVFLSSKDFNSFVEGTLDFEQDAFWELESKQILATTNVDSVVSMLATKFRTKKYTQRLYFPTHGSADIEM